MVIFLPSFTLFSHIKLLPKIIFLNLFFISLVDKKLFETLSNVRWP